MNASQEWSESGVKLRKLAYYWCTRYSNLVDGYVDLDDCAADTVAIAYERYVRWRDDNVPQDVVAIAGSMVRSAAYRVVVENRKAALAEIPESAEWLGERHDTSRLSRVCNRLGDRLGGFAWDIATSDASSVREYAAVADCPKSTVHDRLGQLSRSDVIADLRLARIVEAVAFAL